jgi:hypothetical protein
MAKVMVVAMEVVMGVVMEVAMVGRKRETRVARRC